MSTGRSFPGDRERIEALEARVAELEAAVVFLTRERIGARGPAITQALNLLARYGFPLRIPLGVGRRHRAEPLDSSRAKVGPGITTNRRSAQ